MTVIPVSELKDKLQTYGRTFWNEGVLHFNWSSDTVELTFCGTSLSASFRADFGWEIEGLPNDPNAPKRQNWPWAAVFLDDAAEPVRRFPVASPAEDWLLFQSEKPELHRIRITKLTENFKTFLAIAAFRVEGEILPTERKKKKRLEIVGDSITCGYGNLIKDPNRHFYPQDEDGWVAYGPTAARKLGLEFSCVSVSGITGVRHEGWGVPYYMHELYPYTDKVGQEKLGVSVEDMDFAKMPNDYVVVNLGTNDCFGIQFSPDAEELERFPRDYADFIRTIRRCNGPDAHIVCALGTMNYYLYSDIEKAVAALRAETGDERLHTLRFKPMHPFDGVGADGHPSADTHRKMADELAAFLKTLE